MSSAAGRGRPVALVSGGSRGLGQALVEGLLEDGFAVATFSRSATAFVEQLQTADPEGEGFLWRSLDATDAEALKQLVLEVARRFGRLDLLVNNAAAGIDGLLALMRPEQIERGLALNLSSVLHLTQAASRVMLRQKAAANGSGRGSIINISSVNAVRGHTGVSVYSATKAALDGMTRSLARELGPRGIRVNSVAPGYFESDMVGELTAEQRERIARRTPLGRLGTTREMAAAVRFLASPRASFITGQTLVVDGGITC